MKIDRDQVFRELDPPAGGSARLMAALRERGNGTGSVAWWLGPVAVCSVVTIAIFAFRFLAEPDSSPPEDNLMAAAVFDRLLGRDSTPYVVSVRRGSQVVAVDELETGNPNVRLFSLNPPESAAAQ